MKTIEYMPDDNQETVYTNFAGEVMLDLNQDLGPTSSATITHSSTTATVTSDLASTLSAGDTIVIHGASDAVYDGTFKVQSVDTGTGTFTYTLPDTPASADPTGTITAQKQLQQSGTYYRYNNQGEQVLQVNPSGLNLPWDPSLYEANADLVGLNTSTGVSEYLNSTTGLFQVTDYYGWSFGSTAGIAANASSMAPATSDGNQAAFLTGDSSAMQTVVGWAAGSYTLSFEASVASGSSEEIEVLVDNKVVGTFTTLSTRYSLCTTSSFSVGAGPHTITFEGIGSSGSTAFIDSVALSTGGPTVDDASFESPGLGTLSNSYQMNPSAYASTDISSTPGGVAGYLRDSYVQQGELGTPVLQETTAYVSHTASGVTIFETGSDTTYGNSDGTDARTTQYSYTWYGTPTTTNAMETETTIAPPIDGAQNGPATSSTDTADADTTIQFFNEEGQVIWTKNGNGSVDYTAYDLGTGAVIETITDVVYGDLSSAEKSSFDLTLWSEPSGGLNLKTTNQVDGLGRLTEVTSPNGNETYTVYNDPAHETRVYPGFNGTTTTGPIQIYLTEYPSSGDFYYTETMSSSATPHLNGGVPDGTEAITASNIDSLERDFTNAGGEVIWSDKYFNFSGLTFTEGVGADGNGDPADIGTAGTNYYRTTYGYDKRARQDRVLAPTGTITRTVYDYLGRVSSTWVGTDDTPTTGWWSPSNTAGANMMLTEQYSYDAQTSPPIPHIYGSNSQKPSVTYYVELTYIINGVESPASPESSLTMYSGYTLDVFNPPSVTGATGYNVYISFAPGQEVLQNTSGPESMSSVWVQPTAGTLVTGTAVPPLSGVGDGTLTYDLKAQGAGQPSIVTQYIDDWRDRQVATKTGIQYGETTSDGIHRPITYSLYNNVGEIVRQYSYDGDGVSLSDFATNASTDAVPTADPSKARSLMVYNYDDQGRLYRSQVYNISQSTGISGMTDAQVLAQNNLETDSFYDHDGNIIATFDPSGETDKYVFDGADRLISQYVTDGGAVNNGDVRLEEWADANSVTNDVVLTETDYTYDSDGNIILTATRDRFSDAPQSGVGSTGRLADPSTSPSSAAASYSFSEGTGTTTADGSGNGNSATLNGGVTWTSSGHSGDALTFDGTSGYVDIGNPTKLNITGQITLSAWIKPESTTGLQDIIAHGYASTEVFLRLNGNAYQVGSWDGHSVFSTAYDMPAGDLGNWVHLVGVYDGTAWKLYRNGVLVSSTTASTGAVSVSADWMIGASAVSGDRRYFDGSIDEAKIYSYALTAVQAAALASDMPAARVSYVADYFDDDDRQTDEVNVGTNGGVVYTRPSSPPSSGSSTVLLTHTDYDSAGNVADTIDPRGIKTQYAYDMLGRVTQEIDASTGGSPATGLSITNYTYDGDDHVTSMTAYEPDGTTTSQTTDYVYGVGTTYGTDLFSNDLLAKVEYPVKNSAEATASGLSIGEASPLPADDVSYTYDLQGQTLGMTDQNGTIHAYSYDVLGCPFRRPHL